MKYVYLLLLWIIFLGVFLHTSILSINPNLDGWGWGSFTFFWFYLNKLETVKAITLAFCSIPQTGVFPISGFIVNP